MKYSRLVPLVVLAVLAPTVLWAESPDEYGLVRLSAQAEASAPRDLIEARFLVTVRGSDYQKVAAEVTERFNKLLATIRGEKNVRIVSTSRDGYTSDESGKIGLVARQFVWVDNARVVVTSHRFDVMSALIGRAQSDAVLESLTTRVSNATLRALDDQLVTAGLENFRSKASLIAKDLGFSSYRIVEINVGGGSPEPAVNYQSNQGYGRSALAAVPNPDLEGGNAKVWLDVTGSVQLIK